MKKEMTFEEAFIKLEEIVKKLENGKTELDESMKLYTEGMELSKYCDEKLSGASERVNKILAENGKLEDFDLTSE